MTKQLSEKKKRGQKNMWGTIGGACGLLMFLAFCGDGDGAKRRSDTSGSTTLSSIRAKSFAEEAVNSYLKDPGSAKYSFIDRSDQTGILCGYVNSKNSFGAYTGDKLFAVMVNVVLYIEGSSDMSREDAYQTFCSN